MTLKSSGSKNFLSWWISTFLKSFLGASASLPFYSSTFHQTNVENSQIRSEESPLISRIQSLHLLRGRWPWRRRVLSRFDTGKAIDEQVPGSTSVQDLSQISRVLVDEQAEVRLRGFALAFHWLAKACTFVFNANSSDFISEVSCSLSSPSLLLKSVTNLFNPWEIPTQE